MLGDGLRVGVRRQTASLPYALRHSFVSLLLDEGRSVIYVARQLGHDTRLTLSTYGHVIDELDEAPHIAAEDAIQAARGTRCAICVPSAPDHDRGTDEAGA